ncbi:cytochrome P450 [Pseudobacteriovorax antillogorgiicola]|uniref:Cytochrome P450 n=1 Tax=Pseudobacteriovorax antillogorgiicola TaxID=1513793 RepID=A0A1Y6C3A1_9BACT|nr:cytochrome P450 [Pseudobacteriovorax antillogorgiicola]TCS49835.1 cytochrome P450 [Pseudobacteriovorax antillogorgiicola]SMF43419.1 Cytochrome P450 [Pseudobacteriovorax antillogorgiicola]
MNQGHMVISRPRFQFTKTLDHYYSFKNDPLGFTSDIYQKWGEFFRFKIFHKSYVVTSSPEIVDQVLVSKDACYKRYNRNLKPLIGNAMLAADDDDWKKKRRLSQPFFHPKEISKTRELMAEQIDRAVLEWAKDHDGHRWSVAKLMQRLTLAVVSKVFLKQDVWTLSPRVLEALDNLFELVKARVTNPLATPLWVPTPSNVAFKREMGLLYGVIDGMVEDKPGSDDESILIDRLIHAVDEESGYRLSSQDVRDEVIQYFLAGHETTANLLAFTLDFLAQSPEVQQNLREELLSLEDDFPTMKDLPRLKLLSWTIQEALRLRPSAWFLTRMATSDHQLLCGTKSYPIYQNDLVIMSVWNIHHRPDLWPEPDQFKPERMAHAKDFAKHAYMPFGAGKTSCIGNNFAIYEASLILSKLLRNFKFEAIHSGPVPYEGGITLRPKGDVQLKVSQLS